MLQAVAVMLMVWYHLFWFPERIAVPYVLVLDRFAHVETLLACFGNICVAVFAFVSGYGMRKKAANSCCKTNLIGDYKSIFSQLLKFFSRYWLVYFIFIPIGFLLKVYPVDIPRFLYGLVGKGEYNGEWWYILSYVKFLLLFPLLNLLIRSIQRIKPVLIHVLLIVCLALFALCPQSYSRYIFLLYLCCFIEGMYFVDSKVFETLYRFLPGKSWMRLGVGIALFAVVFVLRTLGLPDYLLVALFVFSIVVILKTDFVTRWFHPGLLFVGKYSTYIWLTHTFFGYYFFQEFTFMPRYSWLIFLWCMALSIVSGMVLEWLHTLLCKGCRKIFVRKS